MEWKQFLAEHVPHAPFVVSALKSPDSSLNLTRVLESLIIAGVTGVFVMYGVQIKLDAQLSAIKERMVEDRVEIKQRIAEIRTETLMAQRYIEERVNGLHGMNGMSGRNEKR